MIYSQGQQLPFDIERMTLTWPLNLHLWPLVDLESFLGAGAGEPEVGGMDEGEADENQKANVGLETDEISISTKRLQWCPMLRQMWEST